MNSIYKKTMAILILGGPLSFAQDPVELSSQSIKSILQLIKKEEKNQIIQKKNNSIKYNKYDQKKDSKKSTCIMIPSQIEIEYTDPQEMNWFIKSQTNITYPQKMKDFKLVQDMTKNFLGNYDKDDFYFAQYSLLYLGAPSEKNDQIKDAEIEEIDPETGKQWIMAGNLLFTKQDTKSKKENRDDNGYSFSDQDKKIKKVKTSNNEN